MTTETYINKIMDETGLTPKEIQELVNEKKAELKGLISDEGALLIIAKELMVDIKSQDKEYLDDIDIKIKDISVGMKNIILKGRINEVYKIFNFSRDDGTEGNVGSFLLNDDSGTIRVVLWDEDTKILEHHGFAKNEIVKIINAYAKQGRDGLVEVHIGKFGKLILNPEDVDHKKIPKVSDNYLTINKIGLQQNIRSVSIEGKVLRISPMNLFTRNDGSQGKVISLTVMDPTGTVRVVFWNEDTSKINNLKVGEIYKISQLNPRQNKLKPDTYELVANANTKIKKGNSKIELKTELTKYIKDLQEKENIVSFKGVITSIDELKRVKLKSGEEVSVFSFQISDDSDSIRLTAWRDKAVELSEKISIGKVVLIKNAKIRYNNLFDRKEVTFLSISDLEEIDEEIHVDINLKQNNINPASRFNRELSEIETIDKVGYYEIKGNIVKEIDIDKNELFIYDACPNCSKKITNCLCEQKSNPEKRMILKVLVDDESASIRATFFGDKAEKLLGKTADEITKIQDVNSVIKSIAGKRLKIRGKATLNNFNEMNRYELNVSNFEEINPNTEVENLIKDIAALE